MRSTFSVIFYLKKDKVKKDGTAPIMGRITLDAPEVRLDGCLAAELCLRAVHGDASHDGRCTVFLYFVFLQIEDD